MREIYFGEMSLFDDKDNLSNNEFIDGRDTKQYDNLKFDKAHFNELLFNNQYTEAAKYAENYHFTDPEKDEKWRNNISILKQKGRQAEAIYSRVKDENKDAVMFAHTVLNGNIYNLKDNNYAKDFDYFKTKIGGDKSKTLEVRLAGKKRTAFGLGWLDWLAKDRKTEQIEDFYNASGLTEKDLREKGVNVRRNNDGSTSLIFSKDNVLSNKILYYTPDLIDSYNISEDTYIKGYDENGKDTGGEYGTSERLFNPSNKENLSRLKDIVNEANDINSEYFKPLNTVKQYSSKVGPALNENLERLNYLYESGAIKSNEYYSVRKQLVGDIDNRVLRASPVYQDYRSNAFNNDPTDLHQAILNQEQRIILHNYLTSIDPSNITYHSQTSNGKFGVLVKIKANPFNKERYNQLDDYQKLADKEIEIFIPGMYGEEVQKLMSKNTSTRATSEINAMQDYLYDYTTRDGKVISVGGKTGFQINGEDATLQEAENAINKDMAIDDFLNTVPYKHVNTNNTLIHNGKKRVELDVKSYTNEAKQYAIALSSELVPNTPFYDSYGNIINEDDIDSIFEIIDSKKYLNSYSFYNNVFKRYKELADIWNQIYIGSNYYNIERAKDTIYNI